MSIAFIGIGTNMGDRALNIKNATNALKHLPETTVLAVSNIYETEPWGLKEQPNFLNGVIKVSTSLSPNALLGALLGIEAAMGRVREVKNGPRVLDLDLLIYDNVNLSSSELTLPHPYIMEREFVLKPLTELTSDEKYITALNNLKQGTVWLYEP
ncbi:MAG: 2-amino-4-hydroxy-6-hydroxymethyldihydropteridine diphosphokinase [Clostridia bacterium]|nr:2-amino-4-hydroxy-6-hydroxymethyldihydropteridine diphosphokinase [Clostridia bacterium]MBQ9920191.1 2-amino-4-hydroxy-6-hydroxymethyldihydropteridine diphosphokinase [Clostridia bacterium]